MVGWSINIIEADGAQEKKVNIASLHKMTIAQVYPIAKKYFLCWSERIPLTFKYSW